MVESVNQTFGYDKNELKSHYSFACQNLAATRESEKTIISLLTDHVSTLISAQENRDFAASKYAQMSKLSSLKQSAEVVSNEKISTVHSSNKVKNSIDKIKNEIEKIKKSNQIKHYNCKADTKACKKAKKHYSTNFGVKIVTNNHTEKGFEARLFLVTDHNDLFVDFSISNDNKILSFDASSFLSRGQEDMLKERFAMSNNIAALLCTLRKIALMKSKTLKENT